MLYFLPIDSVEEAYIFATVGRNVKPEMHFFLLITTKMSFLYGFGLFFCWAGGKN